MLSLKYLNKLFADYAENNTMINSYDSGYIFEINPEPNIQYPLLFTELPSAKISESIDFEFEIYAVDRLKEDNSNLTDVHNTTFKILSDFRTYLRKNQDLAQLLFIEDESDVDFFAHKYADYTAGCKMQIKVKVINSEQLCDIPLNNFDFGQYVNWTYNYSASTANNVTYTFSAGTGLSVSNNNNNITYTYTGSTGGSSINLSAGTNITITTGSTTTINAILKYITGGTGSGSIVTTYPATQSFASGNDSVSFGQNNSANTAYSVILGGQSNLINQTNSKRSVIIGGYNNHIYTSTVASKQNLISNSYGSKIKGNSFFAAVSNNVNSTINGGIYSSIHNGTNNTIIEPNGGYIRNCTILNGSNNIVSGSSSTILNGSGNIAYGSLVGGGGNNKALAGQTVILNGVSNTIQYGVTTYGTIINGLNNTIYATPYSLGNTIINGYSNKITGKFSTIINGYSNTISSDYSIVSGKNNLVQSGHNFTTILNCQSKTSIKANTVHVPNLSVSNGVFLNYLEVASTQDIDTSNYSLVLVDSSIDVSLNLTAVFEDGFIITIKDKTGNSGTNNITINYEGGIDGSTTYTISRAYNAVTLIYSQGDDKFYALNFYNV